MRRLLFCVALASAVTAAIPIEARQKRSTESAIILDVPGPYTTLPTWLPRLGESVTFTTSYPRTLNRYKVAIELTCYQDAVLVFGTTGATNDSFLLGGTSSPWLTNGGPATCVATLYYWSNSGTKYNVLASTQFDVAA